MYEETQCIIVEGLDEIMYIYTMRHSKDFKNNLNRNEMHIRFLNETQRTKIDK